MTYEHVRVRIEDRVGWLEYNRPPVNAFNHQMVDDVRRAFRDLVEHRDVRAIVFASALDRFFTVGADLKVFQAMDAAGMREWVASLHDLVRRMRAAPKPLLAAIHGTAVGGGLEMTMNCDLRFAAADARLGQPEINIAFIPPVGATQTYARLLGRPKALRFLYEGRILTAEEAKEYGFVDEIVPPADLRAVVQAYAADLAAKPAEALAAIRRCVTEGLAGNFEAGLAIEAEEAVRLAGTPDFREGLAAFLEKRPPRWPG